MEPCRGKRHDQNGRSEAKKGQTDAPTKLRGLAGRKFTAEAVDSLHGTAAELLAAVSGPNGIRSPVVRQASLYCPLFSTNSRQTKDEPIRRGGIAEVSGENPAQLQEIRTSTPAPNPLPLLSRKCEPHPVVLHTDGERVGIPSLATTRTQWGKSSRSKLRWIIARIHRGIAELLTKRIAPRLPDSEDCRTG